MVNEILNGIPDNHFVRLMINNHYLHRPIYIPFGKRNQINAEVILEAIKNVLNSNEEFLIDGFLEVNIIHVEAYQGGRTQKGFVNYQTKQKKSKAYIQIENTDNMCMARAIVVSKAFVDNDPQYDTIRDSCKKDKKTTRERKDMQTIRAKALCEAAGVDHTKYCGMEEAAKFQAYLTEYQLCILSREHNETLIFKGPEGREKFIYIHLDQNHYNAITKMTGFLKSSYFCHICNKKPMGFMQSCCDFIIYFIYSL